MWPIALLEENLAVVASLEEIGLFSVNKATDSGDAA